MADYRDDYGQQPRHTGTYRQGRDGYRRNYSDERGPVDRASDEVQSWFGDDDAERRRRMDERRDPDTNHYRDRENNERYYNQGYSDGGYRDERHWGGSTRTHGNRDDSDHWSSSRRNLSDDHLNDYESRGSHFGKGPKNDTRSKERLHERISDEMHDDHELDASHIEVKTHDNGEVTLEGRVDSRWSKRRAENCAYRVRNVRHVQNNIRVEERDDSRDKDTSVARDPDATNRPTTGRKTAAKT